MSKKKIINSNANRKQKIHPIQKNGNGQNKKEKEKEKWKW